MQPGFFAACCTYSWRGLNRLSLPHLAEWPPLLRAMLPAHTPHQTHATCCCHMLSRKHTQSQPRHHQLTAVQHALLAASNENGNATQPLSHSAALEQPPAAVSQAGSTAASEYCIRSCHHSRTTWQPAGAPPVPKATNNCKQRRQLASAGRGHLHHSVHAPYDHMVSVCTQLVCKMWHQLLPQLAAPLCDTHR
jgi:hypothetical protein